MDYSKGARDVLDALRSVREADEGIWFDRAVVAVADLFPNTALAFALCQQDVWSRERRRQIRAETNPHVRNGFFLEDLVAGAEAACAADGGRIVHEIHLAKALAESARILQGFGISADTLIARTAERETVIPLPIGPKRPRVVGAARMELLDEAVANQDLTRLLGLDERTGTVERKRSILNSQGAAPGALADQESAAVALVNGSADTAVYVIFGQDDDLTVRGEIDHRGAPVDSSAVRASQRRFDDRLQACHPPVSVKWAEVVAEGKRVWVACLFGRARGTAVRTTSGAYPYRSGEDTHYATPEQITAWLREPAISELPAPSAAVQVESAPSPVSPSDDGRAQRRALSALDDAIDSFYKSPPTLPTMIQGRKLENWEPVYGPVLDHFRQAIEALVQTGLQSQDSDLSRLARGLRAAFRPRGRISGSTWVVDAPRLVTRLVADRLLIDAYGTERWSRLIQIGEPPFDSYIGRVPWVISPEYRHPETLGRHADIAIDLSLHEIDRDREHLQSVALTERRIAPTYASVTVGLALAAMAREEASTPGARQASWAMLAGVWSEIERWEEEPGLVDAFAALAGESGARFRKALPERLSVMIGAFRQVGYWLDVPDPVWASIKRMAEQPDVAD